MAEKDRKEYMRDYMKEYRKRKRKEVAEIQIRHYTKVAQEPNKEENK